MLDGKQAPRAADAVIGVASSGLHSNGFSLARRVLEGEMKLGMKDHVAALSYLHCERSPARPDQDLCGRGVRALLGECGPSLHGLSHITGGGLGGNLPRVLPDGLGARLDLGSYDRPAIFRVIAEAGPVEEGEMRRTFNLGGVGLVAVVAKAGAQQAIDAGCAPCRPRRAWVLGQVIEVGAVAYEERVQFEGVMVARAWSPCCELYGTGRFCSDWTIPARDAGLPASYLSCTMNLGVLISGRGSNLDAILAAIDEGALPGARRAGHLQQT